jgi:anti-sigma factor RsiW
MNLAFDRFRLHAYVDGELTPDEVADFEQSLSQDPEAMAEIAMLRAQKNAMHARYDSLLSSTPRDRVTRLYRRRWSWPSGSSRLAGGLALAATLVAAAAVGLGAGWIARGQADQRSAAAGRGPAVANSGTSARDVEGRLQAFVQVASVSHAVFVPEVRHPVEVAAADEAHLVMWLSKRLNAPLVVPHLNESGWDLLGGRLLPAQSGPIAQFMYQDHEGRRMTLAVSKGVAGKAGPIAPKPAVATGDDVVPATAAFRIAEENGNTVFYWIDADYAYALTGKLSRNEMTDIASRVYRQLDR